MTQSGLINSSTISSKGQITVPIEIRRRLSLKTGDRVEFVIEDNLTILRPAKCAVDNASPACTPRQLVMYAVVYVGVRPLRTVGIKSHPP